MTSDGAGDSPPHLVLVCASANPDKAAEIAQLLVGVADLRSRPDDVPEVVEDAGSLVGNARLKAAAICSATGLPAVADDTGLFVSALDDGPGVDTAYYAGPHATYAQNRAKMLDALDGQSDRSARFITVALVVWPDGRELSVEGVCPGRIAEAEQGERGWGYDPLFVPDDGDGRTFGQMTEADKHLLGHRGRAFRALARALHNKS
jgi:XTP/dITP diphosphohydrolase